MEALSGSLLNVVLKIREGNGFGFLSSPLIIVANLNGNALETEPITCTASPVFGSDFVWEAEKKILRRMRSGNTSLRIECMSQKNGRKKEKIGYILLNLKQAQIINSSAQASIVETWYRLLGVRPEMKPHNPEILLSLLIKEADFSLDQPLKGNAGGGASKPVDECGYIQIGPAVEATQLYSFSVDITAAINLHTLVDDGRGDGLSVNCLVFGSYFSTKDLSQVNGDLYGERLHLTVRSSPQMLSQYFTEFPQIEFSLLTGLVSIAKASLQLQSFVNGCEGLGNQGCVSKEGRVWFSDSRKAYVDVTVVLSCEGRLPGAESQLSQRSTRSNRSSPRAEKKRAPESHRNRPEKLKNASKLVNKLSKEDCSVKNPAVPETVPESTVTQSSCSVPQTPVSLSQPPQSVPQSSLLTPKSPPPQVTSSPSSPRVLQTVTQLSQPLTVSAPQSEVAMAPVPGPQSPQITLGSLIPQQPIYQPLIQQLPPSVPENPFLPSTYPQQSQMVLPPIQIPFDNPFASMLKENGDPIVFPPPIPQNLISNKEEENTRELTKNIIEELEDWKEKQEMIYKIELKAKCEREVKRLTVEWSKRQAELEAEMGRRVEESANLTEQLHKSAAELAHRNVKVTEFQRQLELEREKQESEYAAKLKDLRDASKKHQHHTSKQLKELQAEMDGLKRKLYSAEQELERYRAGGNIAADNRLTENQMTSLLVDMKCLEEKLAAAIESKEFFRKEWGRALREIHRMKTEQEAVIRQQLEANRNELNNLSARLRGTAGVLRQEFQTEGLDDYPKPEDNFKSQVAVVN